MPRRTLVLIAFALGGFGAGCSRTDPHALMVDAENPRRLASWRENVSDRFELSDWREFEAALQDIRLSVMARGEASGSAAIEEAMCARIRGRTFQEVLALGYEARLARLDPSRVELKNAIEGNAMLVTKPGDANSAKYLDGLRERQEERLRKLDAEIAAAENRLVALSPKQWAPQIAERQRARAGPISAKPLAAERARAEITRFIQDQRAAALLKYGEWPVKIATDAAALPEPERSDFLARRAADAEHTVIAVRVRDRWWIYDDKPELPTFSRSMVANLSELDRVNIASAWANWQAELWARRMAFEQSK